MKYTNCNPCQESSIEREILSVEKELDDLKKPITGEVIDNKIILIRDSEVIGEIPVPTFENTLVFLDAFHNIIPTT